VLRVKSLYRLRWPVCSCCGSILGSARKIIEPWSQVQRLFEGPGFLTTKLLERIHAESRPNPIIDPPVDFREFQIARNSYPSHCFPVSVF